MSTETTPGLVLGDGPLADARDVAGWYVVDSAGLMAMEGTEVPLAVLYERVQDLRDATLIYDEGLGPRHLWRGLTVKEIRGLHCMAFLVWRMHTDLLEGNTRSGVPLTDPENVAHDTFHKGRAAVASRLIHYLSPLASWPKGEYREDAAEDDEDTAP